MGLTIFEETFGNERVRYGKVSKREATADHIAAITNAVQKVVDTFRDPNTGQRFTVSLSSQTEAYTTPDTKRIVVSYQPIFDKGLKVSTVCTVMTGLVLHEIGHTLYTFPNLPAIEAAFGVPGTWAESTTHRYWDRKKAWDQLAYSMLNIGDDARLEARMVENLPVAKSVFPTMLHWVAITSGMVGEPLKWTGKAMTMSDRVNFAGRSVRYPWTARWSSDEYTRAERAWWVNWGAEYIALADRDGAGIVALIMKALDRLRNPADLGYEKAPTPPKPPKGKGKEPGPGGSKPGVEDEDEDEPFKDEFDRDEDEDADDDESDEDEDSDDGDDWADEDGDDDGEDADDDEQDDDEGNPDGGGDESGEDADDDETDDEGNPDGSGESEDEDADDDETDDEGGSKTDAPATDKGDDDGKDGDPKGGGKDGAQKQDTKDEDGHFKDDFDSHDLKGNVDAINRPEDWKHQQNGTLVQKLLDTEQLTERVNTGKWGTAKVESRNIAQFIERNRF